MDKRIIYPLPTGVVAIITPRDVSLCIDEIARKDVPAGVPYRIVNAVDIPSDRTFRDAWEADFSVPDGYGIGADAWFAEQQEKEAADDHDQSE